MVINRTYRTVEFSTTDFIPNYIYNQYGKAMFAPDGKIYVEWPSFVSSLMKNGLYLVLSDFVIENRAVKGIARATSASATNPCLFNHLNKEIIVDVGQIECGTDEVTLENLETLLKGIRGS